MLVAPLASRWIALQAVQPPGHHQTLDVHASHEMHAGHAMPVEHAAAAALPSVPGNDPHADHEMGVDCDYCLIAARLISLLVAVLLLLLPLATTGRVPAARVLALPCRVTGTLGARGPPLRLA